MKNKHTYKERETDRSFSLFLILEFKLKKTSQEQILASYLSKTQQVVGSSKILQDERLSRIQQDLTCGILQDLTRSYHLLGLTQMTCKNRFLGVYSYFGFVNEIIVTAPPVLSDPSFLRLLFENKQNKCESIRSTGSTNIRAFPFFIHLHCIPLIVFSLLKTSAFGFRLLIVFSRISLSISHRFFLLLFVLIIFKT